MASISSWLFLSLRAMGLCEQLLLIQLVAAPERPVGLHFLWQLGLSHGFESHVTSSASPSLSQFVSLGPL